jgi:hypothetical protein
MAHEIYYLEKFIIPNIVSIDDIVSKKEHHEAVISYLNGEIDRRTNEIIKKDKINAKDELLGRVDKLISQVPQSDKYGKTRALLNALRDVLQNKDSPASSSSSSVKSTRRGGRRKTVKTR